MCKFQPVTLIVLVSILPALLGAEEDIPSIVTNSPFLPPDFQPPGQPGAAIPEVKGMQSIEFRGVYEMNGRLYFNLFDATEESGSWVTEETAADKGYSIVEFDEEENALTVLLNGEEVSLNLVDTSDKPLPLKLNPGTSPGSRAKPSAPSSAVRRRVIRPRSNGSSSSTSGTVRRTVNRNSSN